MRRDGDRKRQRLVEAATRLIHRQGLEAVTLAQIAEAAGVPLGNLYYYFRTKDVLADAVVAGRLELLGSALARAERGRDPIERVALLLEDFAGQADEIARYGCPFGVLAGELERRGGALARRSAVLVRRQVDWLAAQYRSGGYPSAAAAARALALVCAKQGATQVAQALRDPAILRHRLRALAAEVRRDREPRARSRS